MLPLPSAGPVRSLTRVMRPVEQGRRVHRSTRCRSPHACSKRMYLQDCVWGKEGEGMSNTCMPHEAAVPSRVVRLRGDRAVVGARRMEVLCSLVSPLISELRGDGGVAERTSVLQGSAERLTRCRPSRPGRAGGSVSLTWARRLSVTSTLTFPAIATRWFLKRGSLTVDSNRSRPVRQSPTRQ
jgi:hypothetical protein